MKKILSLMGILLLNSVFAYGEQYGMIIGGVYVDTELVAAAILFLLLFLGFMMATRKMNLFQNDVVRIVVSMALSFFSIYGLQKLGIDFGKIVFDIGIEKFMMQNFPIILLIVFIIAMIFWGIGTVLMLTGIIFMLAGFAGSINDEIVYHWGITLMIGIILFLIGLAIKKRTYRVLGNIRFRSKNIFKSKRRIEKTLKKLRRLYKKYLDRGEHEKAMKILDQIKFLEEKLRELERYARSEPNPQSNNPIQSEPHPQSNNPSQNRLELVRRLEIKRLQNDLTKLNKKLQTGFNEAQTLHKDATKKGWNKTKEGTEKYKKWYRQYTENINTEKEMKSIQEKINKIQSRIK